jgi:hypothetical protein
MCLAALAVKHLIAQDHQRFWFKYMSAAQESAARGDSLEEADELYTRALAETGSFSPIDLRKASNLEQLAALRLRLGKQKESEKLYEQALTIYNAVPPKKQKLIREEKARTLYQLAVFFERQGKSDEAQNKLKQCKAMLDESNDLSLSVLKAACLYELGRIAEKNGQKDEAKVNCDLAKEIIARRPAWSFRLRIEAPLTADLMQGNEQERQSAFNDSAMEIQGSDDLRKLYEQARKLSLEGKHDAAIASYNKALALAKGQSDRLDEMKIRIGIAETWAEKGDLQKAKSDYEQISPFFHDREFGLAKRVNRSLIKIAQFNNNTDALVPLFAQGVSLALRWYGPQSKEYLSAIKEEAKFLADRGFNLKASDASHKAYLLECKLNGKDTREAKRLAGEWLAEKIWFGIGRCLSGDLKSARREFEETRELASIQGMAVSELDASLQIAKCDLMEGNFTSAKRKLVSISERSLKAGNRSAYVDALGCLGFIELKDKRPDLAIEYLKKTLPIQEQILSEQEPYRNANIWNSGEIGGPRANLRLLAGAYKLKGDEAQFARMESELKNYDLNRASNAGKGYEGNILIIAFARVGLTEQCLDKLSSKKE